MSSNRKSLSTSGGARQGWECTGDNHQYTLESLLVLDVEKGYVGPQYHYSHDRAFTTVRSVRNAEHGQWKVTAGFVMRHKDQTGETMRTPRRKGTGVQ